MNERMTITVELPNKLIEKLMRVSIQSGISMTDLIHRGIETDLYLMKETRKGSKILLERKNGEFVRLVREE